MRWADELISLAAWVFLLPGIICADATLLLVERCLGIQPPRSRTAGALAGVLGQGLGLYAAAHGWMGFSSSSSSSWFVAVHRMLLQYLDIQSFDSCILFEVHIRLTLTPTSIVVVAGQTIMIIFGLCLASFSLYVLQCIRHPVWLSLIMFAHRSLARAL